MHQIGPVLVSWTKALAMQGQQRRKARGRPHVRVQRQGAVDGVDGGVELGAQPGIVAALRRCRSEAGWIRAAQPIVRSRNLIESKNRSSYIFLVSKQRERATSLGDDDWISRGQLGPCRRRG